MSFGKLIMFRKRNWTLNLGMMEYSICAYGVKNEKYYVCVNKI